MVRHLGTLRSHETNLRYLVCSVNLESLQDAYAKTLMVCFAPENDAPVTESVQYAARQTTTLLTRSRINKLFKRLGTRNEALDIEQIVVPVLKVPSKSNGNLADMNSC